MRTRSLALALGIAVVAAGCATERSADAGAPIVDVQVEGKVLARAVGPTANSTPLTPANAAAAVTTPATTTTIAVNPACPPSFTPAEDDNPEAQALASRVEAALQHSGFAGHEVSVSVWVDGWGEVVAHNPDLRLFPASNQKVLTAIGVNELIDLRGSLTTEIELLDNDLIIRAGADPTLTFPRLLDAIDTVLPRIGTQVDRVIFDVTEYPQAPTATGWLDWQMPRYVGPLSGLMFENNRWTQTDRLLRDPETVNAERVAFLLEERGISVGSIAVARLVSPDYGDLLATVESESIDSLVRTMLLSSDNQHADLLLMELGRVHSGNGTLAGGAAAVESVLFARCGSLDGLIDDGSGLSRGNLRSARSFVQTMAAIHGTPEGELLRSQLPVGGVSGTLAGRFGGPNAGLVQAKTGTILSGRSLGGWAKMADGRDAIFSVIVNGEDGTTGGSVAAIDALVREIIVNPEAQSASEAEPLTGEQ